MKSQEIHALIDVILSSKMQNKIRGSYTINKCTIFLWFYWLNLLSTRFGLGTEGHILSDLYCMIAGELIVIVN